MKLQQLRHFVALVDCKTMHAASQVLGLSQPALSRSIQMLEKSLDVSLLRREARRVFLTNAGMTFYQHARLVLNQCQRAQEDVASRGAGQVSEVSIGVGGMFTTYMVDNAIANIAAANLPIRLKVRESLFEDLLDELQLGTLDMMFANFPRVKMNPRITLEPLITLNLAVFVRSDHPLASKRTVSLSEILDMPWLMIDQRHSTNTFQAAFSRADLPFPSKVLRTDSLTLIRTLMTEGSYATCMPEEMFLHELEKGSLARLEVPEFTFPRRAGLMYRSSDYHPPAVEAVMNAIRAACSNKPRKDSLGAAFKDRKLVRAAG